MKNDVLIQEFERVDDLHRKGYHIIQNPKSFCFGVDAVLLSGFAQVKKGEKALDLCCGNGIVPLLLEAKTKGSHYYGLELQEESADLARRSVLLNGLEEKITIQQGDVRLANTYFQSGFFDVITVNPPYMNVGGGLENSYTPKTIARHEVLCSLDDVIGSAAGLLRFGGRFYMVHRPHRLTDIMVTLRKHHLEPKQLRFVHSYQEKEPMLVLVLAGRGGRPMINVLPPLVLYEEKGRYTKEALEIYYGE